MEGHAALQPFTVQERKALLVAEDIQTNMRLSLNVWGSILVVGGFFDGPDVPLLKFGACFAVAATAVGLHAAHVDRLKKKVGVSG
jgi:hypothetical protein